MKLGLNILLFLFSFFFVFCAPTSAQERILPPEPPVETYYKATVITIVSDTTKEIAGIPNYEQTVQLKITSGDEKGKTIRLVHGGVIRPNTSQKLEEDQNVVIVKSVFSDNTTYSFVDHYRLDALLYIMAGFFMLVVLVAGKKGFGSILGMICSVFVILQFIVPQILQGKDPLLISILGSLAIMFVTLYLAHGINKRTTIALCATALSLLLTGILAVLFVSVTNLTGMGSEDAYLLQFGPTAINVKGLLLGGIIIGALGVLDDITTSQTAAVFEISKANKKLEFMDLVMRGYSVGKEHIASLVNTLVLAYAGASLGLFILFVLNPLNQPSWVIFNSQLIVEEVIRTLAGSIGLVLAVPITTVLSAWIATKQRSVTNR
ncbi:MAG TPA: YibE/F family protein [Candidatus Levybacteria bacterium]|nr:YibE/F family protein [Candidatus Levybacteria bacterium]